MSLWAFGGLGALGILAGASLAFQAVLNSRLSLYLGTPLRSSLVSYVGGLLCCLVALLATKQMPVIWDPVIRSQWWLWTGGFFGVLYLVIAIWLLPRLGSAPVFALIVTGQIFAALAFDRIGLFGITTRAIDPAKLFGAAFLIAGVILIRR